MSSTTEQPPLELPPTGLRALARSSTVRFAPGRVVPAAVTAVATPVLARLLGPSSFGLLALTTTIALVGSSLLFNWSESVAVRLLLDTKEGVTSVVSDVARLLLFGCIGGAVVIPLGAFVTKSLALGVLAGGLVCVTGLALFCGGAYRAFGDARGYVANNAAASAGRYVLGLAAAGAGFGVTGVVAGWFAGAAFAVVLAIRRLGIRLRKIRLLPTPRSTLAYAAPLVLVAVGMQGLSLLDRLLLSIYEPNAIVGLYALGYSLVEQTLTLVISVSLTSQFPRMLELYDREGPEAASAYMARALLALLVVLCGLGLLLALGAPHFIRLFGGASFAGHDTSFMSWVVTGVVLLAVAQYAAVPFQQTRQTRLWAMSTGIAIVINVVANVALIPSRSLEGAGIATFIGYLVLLGLNGFLGRGTLPRAFLLRHVVVPGAGLAMGGLAWALLHGDIAWPLTLAVVACAYSVGAFLGLRATRST